MATIADVMEHNIPVMRCLWDLHVKALNDKRVSSVSKAAILGKKKKMSENTLGVRIKQRHKPDTKNTLATIFINKTDPISYEENMFSEQLDAIDLHRQGVYTTTPQPIQAYMLMYMLLYIIVLTDKLGSILLQNDKTPLTRMFLQDQRSFYNLHFCGKMVKGPKNKKRKSIVTQSLTPTEFCMHERERYERLKNQIFDNK